jgi:hypothetical protein
MKVIDFPTEIRIGYLTSQKPYPLIQPAASPIGTVALNFADKMLPAGSGSCIAKLFSKNFCKFMALVFIEASFSVFPQGM